MSKPETALLFTGLAPASLDRPNELLPLLGRPLLQRAVEALAGAGVRDIQVMLGDEALPFRLFLEDGARWGCRITYHHVRDDDTLQTLARRLGIAGDRRYLLADSSRLPLGMREALEDATVDASSGHLWISRERGEDQWTGWGCVTVDWLANCQIRPGAPGAERQILEDRRLARLETGPLLSAASPAALLAAADTLLAEQSEEVTVGRGCRIDPTAAISAPVWLGENVRIGAGCQVGPGAVIGDGCLIEDGAVVQHALAAPETFVGEGLELNQAVVAGGRLANVRLDTVVEVSDADLLSTLPARAAVSASSFPERALAAGLLLVLAPLRAVAGIARRKSGFDASQPIRGRSGLGEVRLSMGDPSLARRDDGGHDLADHFRDCFYPGLRDVVAGRLSLLGPTPRSPEAVVALPENWRQLYLTTRSGLISEGLMQEQPNGLEELAFASDSLAAATQNDTPTRRRILRRYLRRVAVDLGRRWMRTVRPEYARLR